MTTRDTAFAAGTPCWIDLFSADPAKAKEFYGAVFGWTAQDSGEEFGGYVTFFSDGQQVAGMMQNPEESGTPDLWSTYISSDDIDATVAAATAAGAQVVAPAMAVSDLGSMAVLIDPAGGAFGIWQPGKHTGFNKYNEPNSVTWDEYHSKDFATTKDFYAQVFDWTYDATSDTDEFRYYNAQINGETVAGMMDSAGFLPAEVPSHWAVYFSVEDTDAAMAKVVQAGGSMIRPPEDTPFGRIADVADPTGALFKLHSMKMAESTGS